MQNDVEHVVSCMFNCQIPRTFLWTSRFATEHNTCEGRNFFRETTSKMHISFLSMTDAAAFLAPF